MFRRLKRIFAANTNAMLDKIEDPEKMVDQYIRETESILGDVKGKTADAIVLEKKCATKVDKCKASIDEMNAYAKKALEAGNEDDLAKFIEKRISYEDQLPQLQAAADTASANVAEMRTMHDQLADKLDEYRNKRDLIKSKAAVLKVKSQTSAVESLSSTIAGTAGDFARMEERLDDMLIKQEALNSMNTESSLDEIKAAYNADTHSARVAEAIEAFKAAS